MPNAVARLRRQARVFVADETEGVVKDPSQLVFTRPIEHGFVVDTHVQAMVWDRALALAVRCNSKWQRELDAASKWARVPLRLLRRPQISRRRARRPPARRC